LKGKIIIEEKEISLKKPGKRSVTLHAMINRDGATGFSYEWSLLNS